MNRRQKKKEYKKRVGCNPPKGRKVFVPLKIRNEKELEYTREIMKTKGAKWMKTPIYNMETAIKNSHNWQKRTKRRIEPVVVTARRLSEARKEKRGIIWKKARRKR